MRLRFMALGGLLTVLPMLTFLAGTPVAEASFSTPHLHTYTLADSLQHTVRGGETLIFALPDALPQGAVASYRILEAPAMSWLQDRSFFWRTRTEDAGQYEIRFLARLDAQTQDTVSVVVQVD